jgi:hypothetical protein
VGRHPPKFAEKGCVIAATPKKIWRPKRNADIRRDVDASD